MSRNRNLHTSKRVSMCAMLVIAWGAQHVAADGFRNPPEGAAVLGRGGAHVTEVNDASAVRHNPANTADAKASSAMVSATIGYTKTTYTAPNGETAEMENHWMVIPSVFGVMPLDNGYVLGVGLTSPYGQSTEWKKDSILRFSAPYFAELRTVDFSPTLAKRVSKSVAVGAGVDVMWSNLEFKQLFPLSPPAPGLTEPTTSLNFDGDGIGLGAHVGVTWDVTEKQRVAVTYRAPTSIDYDGDFAMEPNPGPVFPPPVTSSSDFSTTVDFPQVVELGYSVQVADKIRVEGNVDWAEHSRNTSIDLDIANNNALLLATQGSTAIPQAWDDTWIFAVGGDWQATPEWTLRAGWTYLPTPIPDETLAPSLAQADKQVLGIGAGYAKGGHRLDLSYAYNIQDDREITTPANPVNGTYEFNQHLLGISYAQTF